MEGIVTAIADFTAKIASVTSGMTGIYAALVALALLGILFSRIGK